MGANNNVFDGLGAIALVVPTHAAEGTYPTNATPLLNPCPMVPAGYAIDMYTARGGIPFKPRPSPQTADSGREGFNSTLPSAGSGNLDASHVLPAFDTSFNPRTDGTTAMEPSPVLAPAPPEGTAHCGGPQSTAAQFMFSASVIVHDFIASKIYPEVGRAQLSALIVGSDHSNMDTATPHEGTGAAHYHLEY